MAFVTGNPEADFFDQNPELKYVSEFKLLIKELGKRKASKTMWCLFMIEDPKSKIFRMPRKDRIVEVKENYYSDYNDEEFRELAAMYGRLALEKEENLYKIHVDKLDELTAHLQKLSVENDTEFSKYIRIIDKLPKVWLALERVRDKMIKRLNKTNIRGGAQQSSRERRRN